MCHVGSPGKAAGVPRWVSQSSSPCRRCDTSRALRCRASSFAAWLRRCAVPKAWRCSQGKSRSTPVMARRSRGQWIFCDIDVSVFKHICTEKKRWPRCFFLPFSSGFSRTLRALQLWLVSLPGQGLGWRCWDLVVRPWWIGELAVRSQYWPPRLGLGTVAMLRGQVFFCRWDDSEFHIVSQIWEFYSFSWPFYTCLLEINPVDSQIQSVFGSCRILWSMWTTATWWRSRRWSCLSAEHQWPSPREPSGGSLEGLGPEVARCTAPETTKRSEVGELVEHRGAQKTSKNIQKTSSIHISISPRRCFCIVHLIDIWEDRKISKAS